MNKIYKVDLIGCGDTYTAIYCYARLKKELNRYVKFKKKMKNKNAEVCKRLWMLKDKVDY